MKKSQLRNIIRESIEETHNSGNFQHATIKHVYEGYFNYGNTLGFAGCSTNGNQVQWVVGCDPSHQNSYRCTYPSQQNVDDFYQMVGSPSVGQFIGADFQPPGYQWNLNRGCWKYLGTTTGYIQSHMADYYTLSNYAQFSDCQTCYSGAPSGCDTTPTSACATQWFGNTAGNFTNFMSSKDCSNYQSVVNNLEPQANALMAAAPTPQSGPYSDWNAIKNAANASGLGQPQKGQFKRKMAKAMYAQCQFTDCSC